MRLLITLLSLTLLGCVSQSSQGLQESKVLFKEGHYQAALPKLTALAQKGDPRAQYALAYMYYNGQGVYADETIATLWMKRAAEQGYKPAKQALELLQAKPRLS